MSFNEPRDDWFFWSRSAIEAHARLDFCLETCFPLALLTGPAGVGKSALVKEFSTRARRNGHEVLVASAEEGAAGLERSIGASLHSTGTIWEEFETRSAIGRPTLVVLDHVDGIESAGARLVDRLSRLPDTGLVLVGRDELRESRWCQGRSALRVELEALPSEEVGEFVERYFEDSACRRTGTEEVVDAIDAVTSGVPRDLRLLLRLCGSLVEGDREAVLDADVILGLAEELGLGSPVRANLPRVGVR